MSRKAFIGDTLKYRKPRFKLSWKTTLSVMYTNTSRFSISHRLMKASRDVCHVIFSHEAESEGVFGSITEPKEVKQSANLSRVG
jgi:hypothetical protein